MRSGFLRSKNFKSRVFTGVILGALAVASLFTPNAFLFRIIFAVGCGMAILELYVAHRHRVNSCLIIADDRILVFEYAIIIVASYAVCTQLTVLDIWFVLVGSIAADIFAYLIGSAMHGLFFISRPFPNTSPKKSWEGIIGGGFASMLILLGMLIATEQRMAAAVSQQVRTESLIFVILCPCFSVFGDYLASFCKRLLSIKDSNECIIESNLIVPKAMEKLMSGHGGYLDRIDSITMVSCIMLLLRIGET